MEENTEKLEQLRPVTFKYKSEPNGERQFGLIAEEVAKVFPELVIGDAKGQILSVRYDELAPILLNEMKLQSRKLREQDRKIREKDQRLRVRTIKPLNSMS